MKAFQKSQTWDAGDCDQSCGLSCLCLPLKEIQCCVNQTENLQHHMEINAVKYLDDCFLYSVCVYF